MARVVLILLVVLVAAFWLVGRQRRLRAGAKPPPAPADGGPEAMLQCAHCGVHLPRGDAVMDGAHAYCSSAHRAAGPRAR